MSTVSPLFHIRSDNFLSFSFSDNTTPFLLTLNNPLSLQAVPDMESFQKYVIFYFPPLQISDGCHYEVTLVLLITFNLVVH